MADNFVPKANETGDLGRTDKRWNTLYSKNIITDSIKDKDGNNLLETVNDLKVAGTGSEWSKVSNKPFTSVGNGLSVSNGVLTVNSDLVVMAHRAMAEYDSDGDIVFLASSETTNNSATIEYDSDGDTMLGN